MNWKNITVAAAPVEAPRPVLNPSPEALEEAAKRWDARTDSFAQGKNATCRDIAAKLRRFGSYASEAQRGFAEKLVAWSLPRQPAAAPAATPDVPAAPVVVNVFEVPDLFAVMQKHSKFIVNELTIQRANQDSKCWIKFFGIERVVGVIDNGKATLFTHRLSPKDARFEKIVALLKEIEANPLDAAMKYGKLSGRCCMCGRDLTDPVSIERGIGPICLTGFGGY